MSQATPSINVESKSSRTFRIAVFVDCCRRSVYSSTTSDRVDELRVQTKDQRGAPCVRGCIELSQSSESQGDGGSAQDRHYSAVHRSIIRLTKFQKGRAADTAGIGDAASSPRRIEETRTSLLSITRWDAGTAALHPRCVMVGPRRQVNDADKTAARCWAPDLIDGRIVEWLVG